MNSDGKERHDLGQNVFEEGEGLVVAAQHVVLRDVWEAFAGREDRRPAGAGEVREAQRSAPPGAWPGISISGTMVMWRAAA
jgi:hypothetical protein